MAHYVISAAAERDIASILVWTQERFSLRGRLRYEALLVRAILDVADEPERTGSHARPEILPAARTYHLRHSRDHVEPADGRVRSPRHFLLYRICDDGRIEIGRVLHERMDLARHLPEDYGPPNAGEQSQDSL
jgi:toxin ParE1/3/4